MFNVNFYYCLYHKLSDLCVQTVVVIAVMENSAVNHIVQEYVGLMEVKHCCDIQIAFFPEASAPSELVHEEGHLSRKHELEVGEKKAGNRSVIVPRLSYLLFILLLLHLDLLLMPSDVNLNVCKKAAVSLGLQTSQ